MSIAATTIYPVTVSLAVTGRTALEAFRSNLLGSGALTLAKFADPTGGPEFEITAERAEEVISADPTLVYLCGEVEFWCDFDGPWTETIAQCGIMQVLVESPELQPGAAPTWAILDVPKDWTAVHHTSINGSVIEAAKATICAYINETVEG